MRYIWWRNSLILKYKVKLYTFLLLFFFTIRFKFQNIVLISFFSRTMVNLGAQIAGAQNHYIDLQITLEWSLCSSAIQLNYTMSS